MKRKCYVLRSKLMGWGKCYALRSDFVKQDFVESADTRNVLWIKPAEYSIERRSVSDCDIIISWNFKHIVNVKTIRGVKVITTMEGFKDLLIYQPTALLEEE